MAELRNMVTSPGGTSAEALYQLEKGSMRTVLSKAVWAAYQRSVTLGDVASDAMTKEPPRSLDDDEESGALAPETLRRRCAFCLWRLVTSMPRWRNLEVKMGLQETIATARGQTPADLVLKNGTLVNVLSGEIYRTDIAIQGHTIVGLGEYEGKEEIDLSGKYICPGFIDGHVHVESTMLPIPEYARAVVPQGTTTVIMDSHEIANVMGVTASSSCWPPASSPRWASSPCLPSCVPASPFETPGATLDAYDLQRLLEKRRVLGMGEMMNYPGVLKGDPELLDKMKLVEIQRLVVDGHAPGLTGKDLNAYVAAGVHSDHESITAAEAREKIRAGMWLMVREGSTEKNLRALLPVVKELNPAPLHVRHRRPPPRRPPAPGRHELPGAPGGGRGPARRSRPSRWSPSTRPSTSTSATSARWPRATWPTSSFMDNLRDSTWTW